MIDARNLVKIYKTGEVEFNALRGVSLSVQAGEFLAIMGPSGSGKSTMLNLLGCLDTPTSGEYYLDGEKVSDLSHKELAHIRNKKIGFVFQGFNLLPRASVLENVELPLIYSDVEARERKDRALKRLEEMGIPEKANNHPNELSGGQRQRVAIARAIVNNPGLILADEPTGNLDSKTGQEVMKLIKSLNDAGTTVIMVTHEEDIAAWARRTVRFRDGQIISDELNGKKEEITST